MKNTTNPEPNYTRNYTQIQLSLPLDLAKKISKYDEVVSFLKALEGVNLGRFLKRNERRGRKGYDNEKLLKVILFGRMVDVIDLRDLAKSCTYDIRFMYLMDEQQPSHMAFERLMKNYLTASIEDIFFLINEQLIELMHIDTSAMYIDGTKIEANANKYSFVYKKRIINARKKLYFNITESIYALNIAFRLGVRLSKCYCSQEMGYICQYLMDVMNHDQIPFVYGKGQRKTEIQRYYDLFLEYYQKLMEYEYWLDIIGEGRNSCSKTDHDATMCATKLDYYCNTGLSRPCYNAQIGVSNGLIINAALYQNPADTNTFIPFMEYYKEHTGTLPKYPVADAAYGVYRNYMYCLNNQIEVSLKYNVYAKKNTNQFKKKMENAINWEQNEKGYKICPNHHVFDQIKKEVKVEDGGYPKITFKMGSKESCQGCQYQTRCVKNQKGERNIQQNRILEEIQKSVDELLGTEEGKELKKQRSIQAEGAFGVIKEDMKFTRFSRRGMKNVRMEFLLVCLGYNFKKYHLYRIRKKEAEEGIMELFA